MKIYLEADLSSYTDERYAADLRLIPAWRREAAGRYRYMADRKRCVRAYMLLWEGLREEYGLESAPDFGFGPHGKPFLPDHPEIHFSLSHTGSAALCALDGSPVGADIETLRQRGLGHLLPAFGAREQAEITGAADPGLRLLWFWTRKESFLKLTGQGLTGTRALREVPTEDTEAVRFETVVREAEGFVYSVCRWKDGSGENGPGA